MTYQQVKDVLQRISRCQRRLRLGLAPPSRWICDERTELIYRTLEKEEHDLESAVTRFQAEDQGGVLNVWIQFAGDEELESTLDSIAFQPGMSADEVVALKHEFDEALTSFLKQLAGAANTPRVEELFLRLAEYVDTRSASQAWRIRDFQSGDQISR